MADEIPDCNIITVVCLGPGGPWAAAIGPPGRGLVAHGSTASDAVCELAILTDRLLWPWDPSWKPRTW